MKAIMVMFDSLNRRFLAPYGCDWVHTPNFQRLADRAATFDTCYVGSMPCMPARREIHTGRYNFLHRGWGPIEPFDDSMPEMLKEHGVHTHLVSDHYHYWEEGGCTYHTRYSTWEAVRGPEGDPWKAHLPNIDVPACVIDRGAWQHQDFVNRLYMQREEETPQARTFAHGLEFLRTNHAEDNWFLTIETFDPHEPYFVPQRFIDLYPHDYDGPQFDWPPYARVTQPSDQVCHCRCLAAALHSMCDHYLGQVLDTMDEYRLWDDTLLIVNTDHGFLLGERDWWGKSVMPVYDEIAHTPLFIWDPRSGARGERRRSLVQTIDLAPTLLEYFDVERPQDMQGASLRKTVAADTPVREAGLFGYHGAQVNVTNGRYVYMRAPADPANQPLYEYTLMPTNMRHTFPVGELQEITLAEPFSFTKGCRTMRILRPVWLPGSEDERMQTQLFDLEEDPGQRHPIQDAAIEQRMIEHMVRLMRETDAPPEQYERLGLPEPETEVVVVTTRETGAKNGSACS